MGGMVRMGATAAGPWQRPQMAGRTAASGPAICVWYESKHNVAIATGAVRPKRRGVLFYLLQNGCELCLSSIPAWMD